MRCLLPWMNHERWRSVGTCGPQTTLRLLTLCVPASRYRSLFDTGENNSRVLKLCKLDHVHPAARGVDWSYRLTLMGTTPEFPD